jgi:hypothetical protein
MAGLLAAVRAARADREAQGEAKLEAPPGMPLSPFYALRKAILKERSEREARGPEAYADVPAVYDDAEPCIEEQKPCALPITPQPET